jgi:hypothetical protein
MLQNSLLGLQPGLGNPVMVCFCVGANLSDTTSFELMEAMKTCVYIYNVPARRHMHVL